MLTTLTHFNHNYSGGFPLGVGDEFYAQDLGRDFRYLENLPGAAVKNLFATYPALVNGGVVSLVSGKVVDITAGYGVADLAVTVPDGSVAWTVPPTTRSDIVVEQLSWAIQSSLDLGPLGLGDNGTYYLYAQYSEGSSGLNQRIRVKKSGAYSFEVKGSVSFTVSASASPGNAYLLLATIATTTGAITSITNASASTLNATAGLSILRVAGDTSVGAMKYNGTTQLSGALDGGTTDPAHSTRLNFDGSLHAYDLIAVNSIVLPNTKKLQNVADDAYLQFASGKAGFHRTPTTYALEVAGDIYSTGSIRGANVVLNTNRNTATTGTLTLTDQISEEKTYAIPAGTYYASIISFAGDNGVQYGIKINDGSSFNILCAYTYATGGFPVLLGSFIISDGTNYEFFIAGSFSFSSITWQLIKLT